MMMMMMMIMMMMMMIMIMIMMMMMEKHEQSEHAENMSYIVCISDVVFWFFHILRVASAPLSGPGGRNLALGMLG